MSRRGRARDQTWRPTPGYGLLALISYLPLVLTDPGIVAADTKASLYLDPGRLLAQAPWLWDPDVALGTVTHQKIGYLFPMGPWFWVFDQLAVPDWLAQRLWLGSILFAAAAGTRWLLGRLGLSEAPAVIAALAYVASPYVLPYFGRTSALLLPWAALPWLTGLVMSALRSPGWRAPALFGLVLTAAAGINASSMVFVALGPALWIPFALFVTREVSWPACWRALVRLGVAVVPAQLWWIAGLWVQGSHGLPILELTETVGTVAQTSTAGEVSRGMGYWYAYGRDGLSPWTTAAVPYTQDLWLLAVSFAVPLAGLVAATTVRWRYRGYFVALAVTGLVLGVGTYPHDGPPPVGGLIKAMTEASSAALALRNTPRAVPLLTLATAALIGAGAQVVADHLGRRGRRRVTAATLVVLAVVPLANFPALWTGDWLSKDLSFPEHLPDYWHEATQALDEDGDRTRVLELPGSDFAAYRWGQTQDPVTPGLLDRPWVGRELTPFGTPPSVDLVRALDRRLQEGVFDPRAVAPIARLVAAGDVLVRADTQFERYRGPRPRNLWQAFSRAPGLGEPEPYGPAEPNVADPRRPMRDEIELGTPADLEHPPALAVFPVEDPAPIAHAVPVAATMLVAGDGESLVDLAEAGMVEPDRPIVYTASLEDRPEQLRRLARAGASLVITDGNRRRAQRWGTLRENAGLTEPIGWSPLQADPKDTRLAVFPDASDRTRTVAAYLGVADVSATSYGNIVSYSPEARPANAIDGDPDTAWQVGGFAEVVGEQLEVRLTSPITVDHVGLTQLAGNRHITEVRIELDGRDAGRHRLDERSFGDEGQRLDLGGPRTFQTLRLTIEAANVSGLANYLGWSQVGIRELDLDGVELEELLVLPRHPLDLLEDRLDDLDLQIVLSRHRADPAEPFRSDPEPVLRRAIEVPRALELGVGAEVRLESRADAAVIDGVLGRPGLEEGFAVVSGSDHLGGAVHARASAALDGDPTTAWMPGLGHQVGRAFHVRAPEPVTIDQLELSVRADGWHSVPTELTLDLDEGGEVTVEVPELADHHERGHVTSVRLDVPATRTEGFTVRVSGVREVTAIEYFGGGDQALPVAIAELGIDGLSVGPLPSQLPDRCLDDLVFVDDAAVALRLHGTVDDAVARRPLRAEPCSPGAGVALGPGRSVLHTADGQQRGWSVDRLVLARAGAATASAPGTSGAEAPRVASHRIDRLDRALTYDGARAPFWLVFGQSWNPGWQARLDGVDLGEPTLVNGHAMGWLIDPREHGASGMVTLSWPPQQRVWIALAASTLAVAVLVWVVAATRGARVTRHVVAARPRWWNPVGEHAPGWRATVWIAALGGLAAGLIAGASVGVLVGAGAGLAAASRWGRVGARLVVPGAYAAAAMWYLAKQWRNDFPMGVEWPDLFAPQAHLAVLFAYLLLGAVSVADARWHRPREMRARGRCHPPR